MSFLFTYGACAGRVALILYCEDGSLGTMWGKFGDYGLQRRVMSCNIC